VSEQDDDFSLQDYDPMLAQLYDWAEVRSCGKPVIAHALRGVAEAYATLFQTCIYEEEDPGVLLFDFAKCVGARGQPGQPRDYSLDAELRELDHSTPRGQINKAIKALAERRGVNAATLSRRRKALRAEDRRRKEAARARNRPASEVFAEMVRKYLTPQ
jgi:hypothetical protein